MFTIELGLDPFLQTYVDKVPFLQVPLPYEFNAGNYQPVEIPSGLDWLKIMYGTLRRHSSAWGPETHASTWLT